MLPHGRPCDRCSAGAQRTTVKQVFARNDPANPCGVQTTRSCWWRKDSGSGKNVLLAARPTVKAYFRLVPLSHIKPHWHLCGTSGILGNHRINRVKTHQTHDHTAGLWEAVLHLSGQVANRKSQGAGSQCPLQGHPALLCPPSTRLHILKVLPPSNHTTDWWLCLHHVHISRHVDLPGLGALSLWVYCIESNNVNWNELYDSFCFKIFRLNDFSKATR